MDYTSLLGTEPLGSSTPLIAVAEGGIQPAAASTGMKAMIDATVGMRMRHALGLISEVSPWFAPLFPPVRS